MSMWRSTYGAAECPATRSVASYRRGAASLRARLESPSTPPCAKPHHGEILLAVPARDERVHSSSDSRQHRERLVAGRFQHQSHVLAGHRELEGGRVIAGRHGLAPPRDYCGHIEESGDLQRLLGRDARTVRHRLYVGHERIDANDELLSAQLVHGGEVGTLAEVFDARRF